MKPSQIALQLYTLRDHLKTPSDIATTLKRVREIGYEAVQVSGMGPIPEKDLLEILTGEGLTLCATHEDSSTILNEPEKVVARLQALNCQHTAYPYPRDIDFGSKSSVYDLIEKLNRAGQVLHEAGQTLSYHNHHVEFRKLDGKTILDTIFEETDPRYLKAELDTYWVQNGGGDSVAYCKKMAGRMPLLHLKDYVVNAQNQPTFAEVGYGNLDFRAIVEAAEASGCEWFIIEQDSSERDPFDSVKLSYDYAAEELCS